MITNGRSFYCALAGIILVSLSSCEGFGGGDGRVVNYPTVSEMARIDREMGLDSKEPSNNSRTSAPSRSGNVAVQPTGQSTPQQPLQPVERSVPQPAPTIPALPPNSTLR